jgi:hypothetical protein
VPRRKPVLVPAQQGPGADCLQRPLLRRSGFRQQLTPSVDMTSDVKGWEQLFYVRIMFFPFLYRKSRSQEDTTVDHADIRGLVTTFLASVGCLPQSRNERTFRPHNAAEGDTKPGLRLFRESLETFHVCVNTPPSLGFR